MNENVPQLSNGNEWEELIRFAGEEHKIPRPNILICGYTGSGKSSLIKTLLGNVVPADKIADGAPKTQGFDCYETPLVRIYDSKGMENGDSEETFKSTIKNFIRKLQEKDPNDVFKHIHLIWYTIQACGARVTNTDCELIQKIFNPNDVIVCLTKADIARGNQKEAMKQEVMRAGIPEKRIIFTSDEEGGRVGCKELMDLSLQILPEAFKAGPMSQPKSFADTPVSGCLYCLYHFRNVLPGRSLLITCNPNRTNATFSGSKGIISHIVPIATASRK